MASRVSCALAPLAAVLVAVGCGGDEGEELFGRPEGQAGVAGSGGAAGGKGGAKSLAGGADAGVGGASGGAGNGGKGQSSGGKSSGGAGSGGKSSGGSGGEGHAGESGGGAGGEAGHPAGGESAAAGASGDGGSAGVNAGGTSGSGGALGGGAGASGSSGGGNGGSSGAGAGAGAAGTGGAGAAGAGGAGAAGAGGAGAAGAGGAGAAGAGGSTTGGAGTGPVCDDCEDDDPCTDSVCTEAGCEHPHNQADCDDGDPCTKNDRCANGACEGQLDSCDDGNVCTVDACDPETGCEHLAPAGGAEADGDLVIPDGDDFDCEAATGEALLSVMLADPGSVGALSVAVDLAHDHAGDLVIELLHENVSVRLVNMPVGGTGSNGGNFAGVYTFVDDAPNLPMRPENAVIPPSTYRPSQPLSAFVGTQVAGEWTLRIVDYCLGDEGTLLGFSLAVDAACSGENACTGTCSAAACACD
jgi:hypothetical protein